MKAQTPFKLPPALANQVILILILMGVVIGLVLTVITLPGFNIPATPTPSPTLSGTLAVTPDAAQLTATAVTASPPVVRVDSIVIAGGLLALIVLTAILREILLPGKPPHHQ